MAQEHLHKFYDVLKKLFINVGDFADPTFDEMLSERAIDPLISWFCDNINESNFLAEEEEASYQTLLAEKQPSGKIKALEIIPESMDADNYDITIEVKKSLDRRLRNAECSLLQMRCMEKSLAEKEKEAIAENNETRRHLTTKVAQNLTEDLISSTEAALHTCYTLNPCLPNLGPCSKIEEETNKLLISYYNASIIDFERMRREEYETLLPEIEHLEKTLTDAMFQRKLSQRVLNDIKRVQQHSKSGGDDGRALIAIEREDVRRYVTDYTRNREIVFLKRDSVAYEYLQPVLQKYRDLSCRYLSLLLKMYAALKERSNTFERFSNLRQEFIDRMTSEVIVFERALGKKAIRKEDEDVPDSVSSDSVQSLALVKQPSALSQRFLEPSQKDLLFWQHLKEKLTNSLSELRCGPTLQLVMLPMKFLVQLSESQRERLQAHNELRHIAGLYVKFIESLHNKSEWDQKLLWAFFLVKPHLVMSLVGLSRESTPSASSTMLNHSMLNFSTLADNSFKPK